MLNQQNEDKEARQASEDAWRYLYNRSNQRYEKLTEEAESNAGRTAACAPPLSDLPERS